MWYNNKQKGGLLMKRIKYIFLILMIIVSIMGLLFVVSCVADLQGKSKKSILYKVECLDYGKVDSISTKMQNTLGNVPGNVESIRFKPIVDPSSKVNVIGLEAETDLEYLGNLVWKLKIKDSAYNTFKIIVKGENGISNEYEFKVATVCEMKSFSLLKNGTSAGYLKVDKEGVIGNDVSISTLYPTIKVDLSSDITNLTFKTKFDFVGTSVKIGTDGAPDNPTVTLVSESTEIDFSNPITKTLRVFSIDNTSKDYKIFVGTENTTIYTDEQIVNGVAVIDSNTCVVLARVDNTTDVYISGGRTFVKSQWNNNNSYENEIDAITKNRGKPMYLASGRFRGQYVKYYPIIKPSDPTLYQLNMVILNTDTPIGNALEIAQEGNAPYMNYEEDYNGKKYVSLDFSIDSADYIIAPPIYVRGRPFDLMWYAQDPKARLVEAVGDLDYNGKYSVMKSATFTAVNKNLYEDLADDEIMAGNWDWKIAEGVVPNKWLYFAFHFGRKNDNVVFSPAAAKTDVRKRRWYEVDAGEAKPNWNNTFKVGKKYTWYIKDYVKGNQARIMIIEED